MTIRYSPAFLEKLKKVDIRIRVSFKKQITIFLKDPNYPSLHNHLLKQEYQGYRSINITADWRALYQEKQENNEIMAYFIILGTHKELYG